MPGASASLPFSLNSVSKSALQALEGKAIGDFCGTGYTSASVNHCAHFVSHVLGYTYGLVCGSMNWRTRGTGATLRVDELFNQMPERGDWSARPATIGTCLIVVTRNGNVTGSNPTTIGQHPEKHVGIFLDDHVWHYSNGKDKVVCQGLDDFMSTFEKAYRGKLRFLYAKRTQAISLLSGTRRFA